MTFMWRKLLKFGDLPAQKKIMGSEKTKKPRGFRTREGALTDNAGGHHRH